MFDRRLLANFDWTIFLVALGISVLGIINLYSAGSFSLNHSGTPFYVKQIFWLSLSVFVFFVVVLTDYQQIARYSFVFHGLSLLLLLIVLLWGRTTAGTHRWLQLGFISFQPSEFAKISFIVLLSHLLSGQSPTRNFQFQGLLLPSLVTLITFILIFLEPDLGTAGLFVLLYISFIFLIKFDLKNISLFIVSGIVLLPCAWLFLEDYQKRRVFAFLNPSKDSLEAGYQIIQSKIAIGSGMLFGKGFLNGTQSQLRFLPEQHTDFVFSVLAEEWGFAGAALMIVLFFIVLSRGLKTASQSRDRLGAFISLGLVLILFWQISINIAMVTGFLPTVGIPLPFVSYGGSSLLSTWIIVGLLTNVKMRKFVF